MPSRFIDELPEAVGIDVLPAGTLSATVSGSGHLGNGRAPLQAFCLYKTPAGELRAELAQAFETWLAEHPIPAGT